MLLLSYKLWEECENLKGERRYFFKKGRDRVLYEKIHFAKKHEFTETDGVYVHRVMGDQDGYN